MLRDKLQKTDFTHGEWTRLGCLKYFCYHTDYLMSFDHCPLSMQNYLQVITYKWSNNLSSPEVVPFAIAVFQIEMLVLLMEEKMCFHSYMQLVISHFSTGIWVYLSMPMCTLLYMCKHPNPRNITTFLSLSLSGIPCSVSMRVHTITHDIHSVNICSYSYCIKC